MTSASSAYYSTKEFRQEQDEWRKQNGMYTWKEWVSLDPPTTDEEALERKLRKPSRFDCVNLCKADPTYDATRPSENVILAAPLTDSVVKRFTGLSELETVGETSGLLPGHGRDDEDQLCGLRVIKVNRRILFDQIEPYLMEQGFEFDRPFVFIKGQERHIPAWVVKKMEPQGKQAGAQE